MKNDFTKNDFTKDSTLFICPVCGETGFERIDTIQRGLNRYDYRFLYMCNNCNIVLAEP